MILNLFHISIPIICLLINVIIQVVTFRYISRLSLLKSMFFGFAIGLSCIFLLEYYFLYISSIAITKDFIDKFLANFIEYLSLGYCYFHFINMGETARRIRILSELYESLEGLSLKEILERYNASTVIERRIGRLINNGQIMYNNGRYYIKGKPFMFLIAKITTAMKLVLIGKKQTDMIDFFC